MRNRERVMVLAIILAIILILVIKQAVRHSHASGFEQTLTNRNFQRCPSCTATKSKRTHSFVCGLKIIESLSVCIKIKRGVAQQRHDATDKNKSYKNICCVCKQKYETACNCVKCNSGRYYSRDCQHEQFNEQEKLRNHSATDNKALPTKLWNKLVKKLL